MRSIRALVDQVAGDPNCTVFKAKGYPNLPDNLGLPADLIEFYSLCGGLRLYNNMPYSFELVEPTNFVRANPVIADTEGQDDPSYTWFIIATNGGEQYITIDLDPLRSGRCYDSFWEIHAVAGSCPIIAESFLELLNYLVEAKGESLYWQNQNFKHLGDAYELS